MKKPYKNRWAWHMLPVLALLLGVFQPQAMVHARPLMAVQTCDEAGLDAALAAGGTNTFSCVGPTTIVVSATKTISVSGTILDGEGLLTISGGGARQVFIVSSNMTVTFQNLTIADGFCSGCNGGAIFSNNFNNTINVINVTFSNNQAENIDTVGGRGGAIYSQNGTLIVSDSTFSNNRVEATGNNTQNLANGGAITNDSLGRLTVTNSTFSNNVAAGEIDGSSRNAQISGGAIASFNQATLTVTNSTFVGNSVEVTSLNFADGFASGGALSVGGTVRIANSTFYANTAKGILPGFGTASALGGAIRNGGSNDDVIVANSTLSGNGASVDLPPTPLGTTAIKGGGIHNSSNASYLTLFNTIIANSTGGGDCINDYIIVDARNNLIEDTGADACNLVNGEDGNIIGFDPNLDSLADNGGPTQTMALLTGSPALNAGNNAVCANPPVSGLDQRGVTRSDGACDIGAFEFDDEAPTVTVEQAAGQVDPTGTSPINFTVTFSEAVVGFAPGDVSLGGTAGATTAIVSEIAPNDGTTYNVAVSGMSGSGTVTASLAASVVTDIAGNPNLASTSLDNTVTYDDIAPTVTVEQAAGQADPTGISPINFTVTFSEPVTGFVTGDVSLSGTAGATTAIVSEIAPNDGTTYNVAVSGMSSGGTVTASLAAGVATDIAGNQNPVSTSLDNTVTYDSVAPLVATSSLLSSYTEPGPGFFTVTFDKEMDDPPGHTDTDDVTNPDNYLLVGAGANGVFDTVSCVGGLAPDDTQVAVTSVSYDNSTFTSTVTLAAPLPAGSYRLFACGTTSLVDLAGNPLGGGVDFIFDFVVSVPVGTLPQTGFAPGRVTVLPSQPNSLAYASTELMLEIPSLRVKTSIVGVFQSEDTWDVTWLGQNAGWLQGSTFPTWEGNTVLTGHVWNADNSPGVFANIKDLSYGDQVQIRAWGLVYTYEVRESRLLAARNVSSVFQHEDYDWLTLLSCELYNPLTGNYLFRRMVRAVLVEVSVD